jgi:hypothetical protein
VPAAAPAAAAEVVPSLVAEAVAAAASSAAELALPPAEEPQADSRASNSHQPWRAIPGMFINSRHVPLTSKRIYGANENGKSCRN